MNTDKICRSRGNEAQIFEASETFIGKLETPYVVSYIERIYAALSGYERRSNENKETSLRFGAQDAERHGDNLKPDA